MDGAEWIEVFASPRGRDVTERELVLRAIGLPSTRVQGGGLERLLVDRRHAERALRELAQYETENVDWPPKDDVPRGLPGAREGTLLFALLLVAFQFAASQDLGGLGWFERGASDAGAVRAGEPWRATTALFLHADPVHLLSNLVFGGLFGFAIAHVLGGGLGWCAILVAGSVGNLVNAFFQDPSHVSIGASTAVFAAVGLLGGSEWRRRQLLRQRRVRIAAPIVMAFLLLAFHGVPVEPGNVDVGAHVAGLLAGLLLGVLLPGLLARGWGSRRGQTVSSLLALAGTFLAWGLALGLR